MNSRDLKRVGLKVTAPRVNVLKVLNSEKNRHLSAENVFMALSEQNIVIGLATVYRVLTQFEETGLVKRHHFENGVSVFELCDGEHHDHLVCTQCGGVEEFYDDIIEQRQELIAKEKGYLINDHSLTIYGLCQACH